jgi:hypothetical protein
MALHTAGMPQSPEAAAIIFSKDRAMQLDALLESYALHCADPALAELYVLFAASTPAHLGRYEALQRRHPHVRFVQEAHFRKQLVTLANAADFLFFLVDDSLFYRGFSLAEAIGLLRAEPLALGYSFRLGRNTVSCYTLGIAQSLPAGVRPCAGALCFPWAGAEGDFGYPLEVSSSLYRARDVAELLRKGPYANPNRLEEWLAANLDAVAHRPLLLCPETSVAFSNPVNRVQAVFDNRITELPGHTADALAQAFDQGLRVDVEALAAETPAAAHHAVELRLKPVAPAQPAPFTPPRISVVIPCYNQGALLGEAVDSLRAQTFPPAEVVVVDDGSTDGTAAIARAIAKRTGEFPIRVVTTENRGLPLARNLGIQVATGDWIFPLDADDLLAPDFFARAVEILREHPETNLVFANVDFFGARTEGWIPEEYSIERIAAQDTFPYASLFPRRLWELAGGYDPGLPWGAEDWNFWITCSELGLWPRRIPEKLFRYRTQPSGMYARMMEHWDEMLALLRTVHPHRHPLPEVLAAHAAIGAMCEATAERVEALTRRFERLCMPWFWLGLRLLATGHKVRAEQALRRAQEAAPPWNWQPAYRLGLLARAAGREAEAEAWFALATAAEPRLASAPGPEKAAPVPQNAAPRRIISTAIWWIDEADRAEILRAMRADSQYADIRDELAGLTLRGFNPADFPISPKDAILYDHWSHEALRRVVEWSRQGPVITTIAHSMSPKGMLNDDIHYLRYEDIYHAAETVLDPIMEQMTAACAASASPHEHLIYFALSSAIAKLSVDHFYANRYDYLAMRGTNIFQRAFLDYDAALAKLDAVLQRREEFGELMLVTSATYAARLRESGQEARLAQCGVATCNFSTRSITHQAVQQMIARLLRGTPEQ